MLRRAAETKNEESDAVVDALLGLEQSCKRCGRAPRALSGARRVADKLTGAWRLVFTTGTVSRQKRTGARVNYFPVCGRPRLLRPAAVCRPPKLRYGIFFGDWAAVRFFGPMEFSEESPQAHIRFHADRALGRLLGSTSARRRR